MSTPSIKPGEKFGKLTIEKYYGDGKYWCSCECGGTSFPTADNLHKGRTKSCGCIQKSHKTLDGNEGSFRELYRHYQDSSQNRKLTFDLTESEFRIITSQNCSYCGCDPTPFYGSNRKNLPVPYLSNGIDRIENSKGYTLDNCVPCCSKCNYMKRALGKEEFFSHILKIACHIQGS